MQPLFDLFGVPPLAAVRPALRDRFGFQQDAERGDPVSVLIDAIISSKTRDAVSGAAFERLIERFPTWEDLMAAEVREIEAQIETVQYPETKAPVVIAALKAIHAYTERFTLDFLAARPVEAAHLWLERIKGVGRKISAAALNFSTLRKRTLVVDTHVLRVAQRIGWVAPSARDAAAAYGPLMALVPPSWDADDLYEFHCLVKKLSQTVCAYKDPDCDQCPLAAQCQRFGVVPGGPSQNDPAVVELRPNPDELRSRIAKLDRSDRLTACGVCPFGDPRVDSYLPGNGLPRGHWHEMIGAGTENELPAAVTGFTASLAARTAGAGTILWALQRDDIHPPGLQRFGLNPDRLIFVRAAKDADILSVVESALRTRGVAAVVGEVATLSLTAGKRLQLACERGGATGFLLRRQLYASSSEDEGTAATTRWNIAPAPSETDEPGLGPPRWEVRLERSRGGRIGAWIMEAENATGDVRVVTELADHAMEAKPARDRLTGT